MHCINLSPLNFALLEALVTLLKSNRTLGQVIRDNNTACIMVHEENVVQGIESVEYYILLGTWFWMMVGDQ